MHYIYYIRPLCYCKQAGWQQGHEEGGVRAYTQCGKDSAALPPRRQHHAAQLTNDTTLSKRRVCRQQYTRDAAHWVSKRRRSGRPTVPKHHASLPRCTGPISLALQMPAPHP